MEKYQLSHWYVGEKRRVHIACDGHIHSFNNSQNNNEREIEGSCYTGCSLLVTDGYNINELKKLYYLKVVVSLPIPIFLVPGFPCM